MAVSDCPLSNEYLNGTLLPTTPALSNIPMQPENYSWSSPSTGSLKNKFPTFFGINNLVVCMTSFQQSTLGLPVSVVRKRPPSSLSSYLSCAPVQTFVTLHNSGHPPPKKKKKQHTKLRLWVKSYKSYIFLRVSHISCRWTIMCSSIRTLFSMSHVLIRNLGSHSSALNEHLV